MYEGMKKRIEHTIVGDVELKRCSRCLKLKALGRFSKDKSRWDNLNPICKACINAKTPVRTDGT